MFITHLSDNKLRARTQKESTTQKQQLNLKLDTKKQRVSVSSLRSIAEQIQKGTAAVDNSHRDLKKLNNVAIVSLIPPLHVY